MTMSQSVIDFLNLSYCTWTSNHIVSSEDLIRCWPKLMSTVRLQITWCTYFCPIPSLYMSSPFPESNSWAENLPDSKIQRLFVWERFVWNGEHRSRAGETTKHKVARVQSSLIISLWWNSYLVASLRCTTTTCSIFINLGRIFAYCLR